MRIENLNDSHVGRKFRCKIYSDVVEGKIQKQGESFYLCQDKRSGTGCRDKLGYKYSWSVHMGTAANLKFNEVTNLELIELVHSDYQIY